MGISSLVYLHLKKIEDNLGKIMVGSKTVVKRKSESPLEDEEILTSDGRYDSGHSTNKGRSERKSNIV